MTTFELPPRAPGERGSPSRFEVEIRPDRSGVIVVPHGELDLATVGTLEAEIDELVATGFTTIVLDLRALSFIDSTGLRLIIKQSRRPDGSVRLIDGSEPVARIFDLTGVRATLPFLEPYEVRLIG